MADYVHIARRMRLPALHFQLYYHIPTMASYQASIISLGVKTPPMAMSRTTSSLELRLSYCLRNKSNKYIVPVKLVAEYAEHLAQIKIRKENKKEEIEREGMERLNRECSDIDWVGLYNSDKLSSWTGCPCTSPITRSPQREEN